MNYLLDTHSFIWFVEGNNQLSPTAKTIIEDPKHTIFLSIASIWEMAIKVRLGKLELQQPFAEFVQYHIQQYHIQQYDIEVLPIRLNHLIQISSLELHHRDPFDRLLIVQSISENTPILSADSAFNAYNVHRIW